MEEISVTDTLKKVTEVVGVGYRKPKKSNRSNRSIFNRLPSIKPVALSVRDKVTEVTDILSTYINYRK